MTFNNLKQIFATFTLMASLFVTVDSLAARQDSGQNKTFNVMAPLDLRTAEQWQVFEDSLIVAKNMGVNGVSIDIWWGKVESAADQEFDWSYYDKIILLISKHDLALIPIMSFHQCGGNVGDDCNIPIPAWIWTHFDNLPAKDLKFKSEQGNYSLETVSFWLDERAKIQLYAQYEEFMKAFASRYASYANNTQELNISMGPAGELRYPSYNAHDEGSGYPTRGAIQGFNRLAIEAFLSELQQKYTTINRLNKKWNTQYKRFSDIKVEIDFNSAFKQQKHLQTGLVREFLNWYHQSLLTHGYAMLKAAHLSFNDDFSATPIGYKIPGIHWQIANKEGFARTAEIAAGLIAPGKYTKQNAHAYRPILKLAKDFEAKYMREVIVHFTALEMSDKASAPAYSKAKTLVSWMSQGAKDLGISIKGENALAYGVHTELGWQNINHALEHEHYQGLTILRIGDVTQSDSIGKKQYETLIKKWEH